MWPEGAGCCSVLGEEVRQQEIRQTCCRGADQGSAGGRRLWMPFQGKTSVSEASGPRGSGLELKEPNFP